MILFFVSHESNQTEPYLELVQSRQRMFSLIVRLSCACTPEDCLINSALNRKPRSQASPDAEQGILCLHLTDFIFKDGGREIQTFIDKGTLTKKL